MLGPAHSPTELYELLQESFEDREIQAAIATRRQEIMTSPLQTNQPAIMNTRLRRLRVQALSAFIGEYGEAAYIQHVINQLKNE